MLNCAIIDDEPLAAELLKSYVEKTPFLNLNGVYSSALTAMRDLRDGQTHLVFLDIQMPELNGIEFAKIIPQTTKIVFITAFPQYAIDGFKVSAMGYLLKPVSYEDFLSASERVLEHFSTRETMLGKDRFFYVKSDYQLQRISYDDILYIEGQKDYVRIYLTNGQKVMSLLNMKNLEDSLPFPEFMRTHRSYIVHMDKVSAMVRFRIVVNNKFIPISDSYKEKVQQYFDDHTFV